MSRPVNADPDRTCNAIIDAAQQLFERSSPEVVGVREIGRQAGVSAATVYHYFGSKEQLCEAVLERFYRRFSERQTQYFALLGAKEPSLDLLEDLVRQAFVFAAENRSALRMWMRSVVRTGKQSALAAEEAIELTLLDQAADLLRAQAPKMKLVEARWCVQSFVYLIVRYAITDPEDLAGLLDLPVHTPEPLVVGKCGEYLATMLRRIVLHDAADPPQGAAAVRGRDGRWAS